MYICILDYSFSSSRHMSGMIHVSTPTPDVIYDIKLSDLDFHDYPYSTGRFLSEKTHASHDKGKQFVTSPTIGVIGNGFITSVFKIQQNYYVLSLSFSTMTEYHLFDNMLLH